MSKAIFISTTALAKKYQLSGKELFSLLESRGLIDRKDESWQLTNKGIAIGGDYHENPKYGRYIVWPENIHLNLESGEAGSFINAPDLAENMDISSSKINYLLLELGWIKKHPVKGWLLTPSGKKLQAQQSENSKSGIPYVRWPEEIAQNPALLDLIQLYKGENPDRDKQADLIGYQDQFPATFRSIDGHMLRSKAEMLIDNWLYLAGIPHAVERKLPIEDTVYADFYLPRGNIYIEFWGIEEDQKFAVRKKIKQAIYQKHDLNLIELNNSDVLMLDDVLPKQLLKFEIAAY